MNKITNKLKNEEKKLFNELKKEKRKYKKLQEKYEKANFAYSDSLLGNALEKLKGKFFTYDTEISKYYIRIDEITNIWKDSYRKCFEIHYKGIEITLPKRTFEGNKEINIEKGQLLLCAARNIIKEWKVCSDFQNEFIDKILILMKP